MSNPKTIKAAAEALQRATAARDKIADAVAGFKAADAQAPSAEEIQRLTQEHEAAAAALVLGETDAATAKSAADALQAAKAAVRAAEERGAATGVAIRGLDARLEAATAAVTEAEQSLRSARVAWIRAEIAVAERDYLEAAAAVVRHHARQRAMVSALRSLGERADNLQAMAADLVLPVIGSASGAQFMAARPVEPHPVGKDLAPVLSPRVDVLAELAEFEAPKPGLLARAAKALTGNGGPAPAGAVA